MVWEKERVLETEALWTMVFESEIQKYAYLDYPDWCVEATKELGLFKESSIYLHMICRENIDSSELMLRRFLKRPAERVFEVMTSQLAFNELVEIPALSFRISDVKDCHKPKHRVVAPYSEGVKITFQYFHRPINIVDEANGTMFVV